MSPDDPIDVVADEILERLLNVLDDVLVAADSRERRKALELHLLSVMRTTTDERRSWAAHASTPVLIGADRFGAS